MLSFFLTKDLLFDKRLDQRLKICYRGIMTEHKYDRTNPKTKNGV